MRIFLFATLLLLSLNNLTGQGHLQALKYQDILRYSQNDHLATARVMGVGGAFGAMGGDYGGVSINPAALGQYWVSEFTLSINNNQNSADAAALDGSPTSFNDKRNAFALGNLAAVFTSAPLSSAIETSSWTIGWNTLASFNEQLDMRGTTNGSILGRYLELSQDLSPANLDDFEAGIAFEAGAIFDYDPTLNPTYDVDFDPYNTTVTKSQTVERKGNIGEMVFGWGANIKRKLNVGFTVNLPIANIEETKFYREQDNGDAIPFFDGLTYSEFITYTGTGIKLNLGATYIVNNSFRIGLAYHTPTPMAMSQEIATTSFYSFTENSEQIAFDSNSPEGTEEFRITIPSKSIASLGYLFRADQIAGFINADIEYSNLSNSSFNLTTSDFSNIYDTQHQSNLNNQIDNNIDQVLSFRIGSEIAFGKFRVRAGAGFNQSPYAIDEGAFNKSFSGGLGIRGDKAYLDLGAKYSTQTNMHTLFESSTSSISQVANLDQTMLDFVITGGYMF